MARTPPKKTGGLGSRPTADLIVIALTAVVAFTIIAGLIGAGVWVLVDPNADIGGLVSRLGQFVNTLIGAIVGYLAGRGVPTDSESSDTG